ncbi:MAG: prevent-host-death protein [Clostridiales bacterium]|jgi:hypothetical protein|nr:prevent-host-death protein [Clostridiales bacterium]
MEFLTVRDFRTSPKIVWEKLSQNGEIVITNNGKPTALMLNIQDGELDELCAAIRQVKAIRSINNMRLVAAENDYMSDEEIEAEIQAYREEAKIGQGAE